MSQRRSSHEILAKFFALKVSKKPGYSLRALARDLGVSPPFLSRIFNGQKQVPKERFDDLMRILEVDDLGREEYRHAVFIERKIDSSTRRYIEEKIQHAEKAPPSSSHFEPTSRSDLTLLENWKWLAILTLLTSHQCKSDEDWIAKKLGFSGKFVRDSIERLTNLGYIEKREGKLAPLIENVRFQTTHSTGEVRSFNKQMLLEMIRKIESKQDQVSFQRRQNKGVMITTSPQKIAGAKKILNQALYRAAEYLSDDEGTEVYYLSTHLLPLTELDSLDEGEPKK